MALLRMNVQQYATYHRLLAQRFMPAAVRGVRSAAMRLVGRLVERTRLAPPANPAGIGTGGAVNTGDYLRGWKWSMLPDGARLENMRPPAPVIEWGRRKGLPPPPHEPIVQWAKRRLQLDDTAARGAARSIARAIGRRGLLPRRILTAPEFQTEIDRTVTTEVDHELRRELGRMP